MNLHNIANGTPGMLGKGNGVEGKGGVPLKLL